VDPDIIQSEFFGELSYKLMAEVGISTTTSDMSWLVRVFVDTVLGAKSDTFQSKDGKPYQVASISMGGSTILTKSGNIYLINVMFCCRFPPSNKRIAITLDQLT
jgi:hypothetical protein